MKNLIVILVLSLMPCAGIGALRAAEAEGPPQVPNNQVPLRVQIVVSRHVGDKRVSSIPYTFSVVANDNDKTSLRMGVDVPVPAGSGSYSYRSVGTNIDCSARSVDAGVFKLDLAVSDSSVFVPEKAAPAGSSAASASGLPAFRSFTSSFNLIVREGQTAQQTSATDPVSGDVLRVEVSVSVVK